MNNLNKLKNTLSKKREDQILILVVSEKDYTNKINDVFGYVSKAYKKIVYIALNKPYGTLMECFKQNEKDSGRVLFIDAVTKNVSPKSNSVVFVSSPAALTDLEIVISDVLRNNDRDCMLVDSVSTLLIYENKNNVVRFMHNIITQLRSKKMVGLFLALKPDVDDNLTKDINMFVDSIITL